MNAPSRKLKPIVRPEPNAEKRSADAVRSISSPAGPTTLSWISAADSRVPASGLSIDLGRFDSSSEPDSWSEPDSSSEPDCSPSSDSWGRGAASLDFMARGTPSIVPTLANQPELGHG